MINKYLCVNKIAPYKSSFSKTGSYWYIPPQFHHHIHQNLFYFGVLLQPPSFCVFVCTNPILWNTPPPLCHKSLGGYYWSHLSLITIGCNLVYYSLKKRVISDAPQRTCFSYGTHLILTEPYYLHHTLPHYIIE